MSHADTQWLVHVHQKSPQHESLRHVFCCCCFFNFNEYHLFCINTFVTCNAYPRWHQGNVFLPSFRLAQEMTHVVKRPRVNRVDILVARERPVGILTQGFYQWHSVGVLAYPECYCIGKLSTKIQQQSSQSNVDERVIKIRRNVKGPLKYGSGIFDMSNFDLKTQTKPDRWYWNC